MKKERRVYTKATDRLKKLFGNKSAIYFSNIGEDDETGVINSHGLSLEDADEVGQFEFLYLVGMHDAFVGERVSGIKFSNDDYPAELVAKQLDRKVVTKPSHYAKGIDTFDRMEANCTKEECLAFAKGNIDKYNWRTKGQDLEDFDKIIAYAEWGKKMLK